MRLKPEDVKAGTKLVWVGSVLTALHYPRRCNGEFWVPVTESDEHDPYFVPLNKVKLYEPPEVGNEIREDHT